MQSYLKGIIFPLLALTLASQAVYAQYVWVDEKGVKQFSDMPPPPSVPASRILKSGGRPVSASDAAPASQDDASASKPQTWSQKNEDYNKRKTEQAEKDRKANQEKQASAEKAKYCDRARGYQRDLESGIRISSTDKNGERNFMTDEQRAKELDDLKHKLADCQQ